MTDNQSTSSSGSPQIKSPILDSYTIGDKTQTATQWAKERGINKHTLYLRLKQGMSIEDALNKPIREYKENQEYDGKPIEFGITQFHCWTVMSEDANRKYVVCQCQCGKDRRVNLCNLRQGTTKSCGDCGEATTHGKSNTRTYRMWQSMIYRVRYHKYYDRKGITVCQRWQTFENFLEDMGECPTEKNSLDRHPNKSGNYEPGNCRWADSKEQREKSNTKKYSFNGQEKPLYEWAEEFGFSYSTVANRLERGWSIERALTTPQGIRRGRGSTQTKDRLITYKGKTQTLAQWAVEFDLNLTTMIERVFNQWSMEKIESTRQQGRGGYGKAWQKNQQLRQTASIVQKGSKLTRYLSADDARSRIGSLLDTATDKQLEKILNALGGGQEPLFKMDDLANDFFVADHLAEESEYSDEQS